MQRWKPATFTPAVHRMISRGGLCSGFTELWERSRYGHGYLSHLLLSALITWEISEVGHLKTALIATMVLIKACREKRGSIFREVELTSKMELLMLQASDCGLHDTVNIRSSNSHIRDAVPWDAFEFTILWELKLPWGSMRLDRTWTVNQLCLLICLTSIFCLFVHSKRVLGRCSGGAEVLTIKAPEGPLRCPE